jgi:hypothetical protein
LTRALVSVGLFVLGCSPARAPDVAVSSVGPTAGSVDVACSGCHFAIVEEWRTSLHRASHDDPSYLGALTGEPVAFCNGCHAPEHDPSAGVSCATCHAEAHRPMAHRAQGSNRSCAGCHEFMLPTGTAFMQRTASEHRASAYANASCESCHMPSVGAGVARHRSHAFLASRDPATLRRALAIEAVPLAPGTIEVTLRLAEVGHAVPTGDMFRRLVVRAEALDPRGRVVGSAERRLARRFALERAGYVEVADERPGGARGAVVRVPLDLGESAAGARIRYRVDHERVTNDFRAPERVEASIMLAEGEIDP